MKKTFPDMKIKFSWQNNTKYKHFLFSCQKFRINLQKLIKGEELCCLPVLPDCNG